MFAPPMNAATMSLINAITLIAMGLWAYFGSDAEVAPKTALIPVVFGVLIGLCNPGLRKENKIIAHIAVFLTVVILLGLFMPLRAAIGREDMVSIARVAAMIVTTVLAIIAFVQSFRAARRARTVDQVES